MAASNILKSAAGSLTGGIEKAILEIADERALAKPEKIQVVKVRARSATVSGTGSISSKLNETTAKIAERVNAVYGMDKAANAMKTGMPMEGAKKKRFEVMFNPSQITFQGMGGEKAKKTNFANGDKRNMKYQKMNPRIQMNIQLIFDDYERTEAFMLEKLSDATAIARTAVTDTIFARTHSVQPQVEGLIGALRNDYTRKIKFCWGTMEYQGILTHVSAEYTMFSTDGAPIRANVNIGMLLTDDSMTDDYLGQWHKSYQEVFEKDDPTNMGSKVQNLGNLININL